MHHTPEATWVSGIALGSLGTFQTPEAWPTQAHSGIFGAGRGRFSSLRLLDCSHTGGTLGWRECGKVTGLRVTPPGLDESYPPGGETGQACWALSSSQTACSLFPPFPSFLFVFLLSVVLGIRPRTSHTLGSCSTTELHTQPDGCITGREDHSEIDPLGSQRRLCIGSVSLRRLRPFSDSRTSRQRISKGTPL